MEISIKLIRQVRSATGGGVMDCKNALTEASGDVDKAIDILRAQGVKRAARVSSREAGEGMVAVKARSDAIACVSVNCETDFVARGDHFISFSNRLAELALEHATDDVEALLQLPYSDGETVESARVGLVAKVGENIQVRQVTYRSHEGAHLALYQHGTSVACGVFLDVENEVVGRDVAMHIVALRPLAILPEDVSESAISRERALFETEAAKTGKPELVDRIISGKMAKYFKEVCLLGQEFVKDKNLTVQDYLSQNKVRVLDFVRVELGD